MFAGWTHLIKPVICQASLHTCKSIPHLTISRYGCRFEPTQLQQLCSDGTGGPGPSGEQAWAGLPRGSPGDPGADLWDLRPEPDPQHHPGGTVRPGHLV